MLLIISSIKGVCRPRLVNFSGASASCSTCFQLVNYNGGQRLDLIGIVNLEVVTTRGWKKKFNLEVVTTRGWKVNLEVVTTRGWKVKLEVVTTRGWKKIVKLVNYCSGRRSESLSFPLVNLFTCFNHHFDLVWFYNYLFFWTI